MVWENVGKKNMTDLKIDWILFHVHLAVDDFVRSKPFQQNVYISVCRGHF